MPRRIPKIALKALQPHWWAKSIQSQNLLQHLNRIPKPTALRSLRLEARHYVDEEMYDYPSTLSEQEALQQQIRKAMVRGRGNQSSKADQLEELSSKLERIMSYLELSELSEIVSKLNQYEVLKNRRSLVHLLHMINYSVSRGTIREQHIVDMAKTVMQQIRDSISGNSNLIV